MNKFKIEIALVSGPGVGVEVPALTPVGAWETFKQNFVKSDVIVFPGESTLIIPSTAVVFFRITDTGTPHIEIAHA